MIRPRLATIAALLVCLAAPGAAGEADTAWDELIGLSAGRDVVTTYAADFRQEKFTPLLRDPIVSTGRVVMRAEKAPGGGGSRWDTRDPYASTMIISAGQLRLYYPEQNTLE
ncbi:MAG: hypothetical protein AAGL98_05180, partial [Planctomycetota bacterium]